VSVVERGIFEEFCELRRLAANCFSVAMIGSFAEIDWARYAQPVSEIARRRE
jgi:hypothetical protein